MGRVRANDCGLWGDRGRRVRVIHCAAAAGVGQPTGEWQPSVAPISFDCRRSFKPATGGQR